MISLESPSATLSTLAPRAVGASPCQLCGNPESVVLANRGRHGKPLRTVICLQCGLVWSDPLPHNPREFYTQHYRLHYKGTYTPKPKHILRAGRLALARCQTIRHLLPTPQTILDVGSGGGEFIYLLHKLGHTVQGIEPNRGYAEYAESEYGLQVHIGFAQDVALPEEHFDLITMWHVLEHTERPAEVLLKLHRLLKPSGILVIEVPNVEATCQAPQNTFHEAHIFNFNLSTLQKLAEKNRLHRDWSTDLRRWREHHPFCPEKRRKNGAPAALAIPGNAESIIRIVRGHTPLKHYTTAHPYRRLWHRLRQYFAGQYGTRDFTSGKALLDQLYAPTIRRHVHHGTPHQEPACQTPPMTRFRN